MRCVVTFAAVLLTFRLALVNNYTTTFIILPRIKLIFATAFSLLSVGAVGGAFAGIAAAKEEAAAERRRRDMLRRKLDADMIVRVFFPSVFSKCRVSSTAGSERAFFKMWPDIPAIQPWLFLQF